MKYYAYFTLTAGDVVRMELGDETINLETDSDNIANTIVSKSFWHAYGDGKLIIVNMQNVTCVTVCKSDEEVIK